MVVIVLIVLVKEIDMHLFKELVSVLEPDVQILLEETVTNVIELQGYEITPLDFLEVLLSSNQPLAKNLRNISGLALHELPRVFYNNSRELNPGKKPVFSIELVDWFKEAYLYTQLQSENSNNNKTISAYALIFVAKRQHQWWSERVQDILICFQDDDLVDSQGLIGSQDNKPQSKSDTSTSSSSDILKLYTQEWVAAAKEGRIDPVLGRSQDIRDMETILLRRKKNNCLLVGEPGVGKTAVVEGLALALANNTVPKPLQGYRLYALDMGALKAGASVKGEFESRLKSLIKALEKESRAILFIDEAHTLIGAGGDAGLGDAANLLKPMLARGGILTIAATTWSEYKQYFERDKALERRFARLYVGELDDKTCEQVLSSIIEPLSKHHKVVIDNSILSTLVAWCRRYLSSRPMPDAAIDVLDTACSTVQLSQTELPEVLHESSHPEYTKLKAHFENREQYLTHPTELNQWHYQWYNILGEEQGDNFIFSEVSLQVVAEVISQLSNIPIENILRSDSSELLSLKDKLNNAVMGQSCAVSQISQRILTSQSGLNVGRGPKAVLAFCGSSGVGKTEVARVLTTSLWGSEDGLVRINMSEYSESHTVSQLKGSPPGYVGYGEGGVLSEALRQRPHALVLLDEFEKAHVDVMKMFYQIFDEGLLRDGEGREINASHATFIITTNVGSDALLAKDEQAFTDACLTAFGAPLMGRWQTIAFEPLDIETLKQITLRRLENIKEQVKERWQVLLLIEDTLVDEILERYASLELGARGVLQGIESYFMPKLAEKWLQDMNSESPDNKNIIWRWQNGEIITDG